MLELGRFRLQLQLHHVRIHQRVFDVEHFFARGRKLEQRFGLHVGLNGRIVQRIIQPLKFLMVDQGML